MVLMLTPSGHRDKSMFGVSPRLGLIPCVCTVYSRATLYENLCKNGVALQEDERRLRVYKSWQWLIFLRSLAIVMYPILHDL
jgi:hypothetical protein